MMGYSNYGFGMGGGLFPVFGLGFILMMLWSIFWKGLALWHSSQRNQPWWFLAILVVNTLGILEIIYLFGVAKVKTDQLFNVKKHKQ